MVDRTNLTEDVSSVVPHDVTSISAATKAAAPPKKKGAKPKLTAKEKKERSLLIDKVASALPLEFRGNDPNLRRHLESVVETFLNNTGRGIGSEHLFRVCMYSCSSSYLCGNTFCIVLEFVKPPDLNQARANKCLIALVNRKIVQKNNSTVRLLFGCTLAIGIQNLVFRELFCITGMDSRAK